MIERQKVDGREASVMYLDGYLNPVDDKDDADLIKIVWDGGETAWLVPESDEEEESDEDLLDDISEDDVDWDESKHPRDEGGKFGHGGQSGESNTSRYQAALNANLKGGSAERVAMRKLLKETTSPELRSALTQKIQTSFLHQISKTKDETKKKELEYKLAKTGYKSPPAAEISSTSSVSQAVSDLRPSTPEQASSALFSLSREIHHERVADRAADEWLSLARDRLKSSGIQMVPEIASHIVAYSHTASGAVNSRLRSDDMTESTWNHVKALNDALEQLPEHRGVTYRSVLKWTGMSSEDFRKMYKVGDIIEEKGFTSSSKHPRTGGWDLNMKIHGRTGRDISKLADKPKEEEVLFRSGTRFRVLKNDGMGNVELEEVGR